jgi:hypothetical protein
MSRCEGYYRVENRRCDRQATGSASDADGQQYDLCDYHLRHDGPAARWQGETDRRITKAGLRRVA